jgi:hypothetical protein
MQQSVVSPLQHHDFLSWLDGGLIGNYPGGLTELFPIRTKPRI